MKYRFYYDESEHSRSIGLNTITANNFYDNFITVIVGWKAEDEQKLQDEYLLFEQKYIERQHEGELKSETIKPKQLRYGFASTTRENVELIDDYLNLFSDDIYIYISSFSKVEYIVNQLFREYKNTFLFDIDMMKYSIIKSLVIYKPYELVDAIYNNPQNIIPVMKKFFEDRIEKNKVAPSLKQKENESFEQILMILDDVQPIDCIDWDYTPPFVGFHRFLKEKSITDYSLVIDREGQHQKTVLAARNADLKNVTDNDSRNHFGIRMADMFAGLIAKLMKSLCKALHPTNPDIIQKTILGQEWFKLSNNQLMLYKKTQHIFCELNNAWYKSFAGIYADDLVCVNSLLNFMSGFENAEKIKEKIGMQGEYFNSFACRALLRDYGKKEIKLPIDAITSDCKKEYYFNQRGAKVYFDTHKQPMLTIPNGSISYKVLSVGFDKIMTPLITIEENNVSICYRLPEQLLEWAVTTVAIANEGVNMFPSFVTFTKRNEKYYVDII